MRNRLHRDVALALQDAKIPLGYPNRIVEMRPTASPLTESVVDPATDGEGARA